MNRVACFVLFFLFVVTVTSVMAVKDDKVDEGWYAFKGDTTRVYILDPPKGMEKEKKYPLVILLHGFTGNAKKIAGAWHWTPGKEGVYVLAPKAPATRKPGGLQTYGWNPHRDQKYLTDLVKHVLKEYPIDKTRVYVIGYGSGAEMGIQLVKKHPRLFSKLAMVGGGSINKSEPLPGFKGLSVYMLAAERDMIFTTKKVMPMAERMKKAGAEVKWKILLEESPGNLYTRTEVLSEWLFE